MLAGGVPDFEDVGFSPGLKFTIFHLVLLHHRSIFTIISQIVGTNLHGGPSAVDCRLALRRPN